MRHRRFVAAPPTFAAFAVFALSAEASAASPPSSWSLALSVDGGTSSIGSSIAATDTVAVVGAPFAEATSGGPSTGAVFAYTNTAGTWTAQKLTAATPVSGGNFGTSVAVSGDLVAVGAAGTPPAAYVFAADGGSYELARTWSDPTSDKNASFGGSVAVFSGGSGDSYVAIAAPPGSSGTTGYVYVARQTAGGAWSTSLVALSDSSASAFGIAIAFAGNGQLLVGDPGTGAGQVLVYSPETDGGWASAGTLPVTFGAGGLQQLGNGIATSDDLAVVAAPGTTGDAGTANGAVFVFSSNDAGVWSQQAVLTAPATESFANFIPAINDGLIAVGSAIDTATSGTGRVDIWSWSGGVWTPVTAGALVGDSYYGQAVGIRSGSLFIGDTSAAGAATIGDVTSSLFIETPDYGDGGSGSESPDGGPSSGDASVASTSGGSDGGSGAVVSSSPDASAGGNDGSTSGSGTEGGSSSSSGCSCTSAGAEDGTGALALMGEAAVGLLLCIRRRRSQRR